MSTPVRRGLGLLAGIAALLLLGALSRVPYAAEPASHAVLRLAWRTRGTRVEECRHRTAEELARLPIHMRESEVCEGRLLPYDLTVAVDGGPADSVTIRAAGVREDRPLYVFRERVLAPGTHHIHVEFVRERAVSYELQERDDSLHVDPRRPAPSPARLDLDTVVVLGEREIALVTYDPDQRSLVLKVKAGS